MKSILSIALVVVSLIGFAQQPDSLKQKEDSTEITKDKLLKEMTASACKCVQNISLKGKTTEEKAKEIHECLDSKTMAYQLSAKLMGAMDEVKKTKAKETTVSVSEKGDEYKKYYFELERELFETCPAAKELIASNELRTEKSHSQNDKAIEFYNKGVTAQNAGNTKQGLKLFKKAVKEDPNFAYAWDNIGIAYRKLGDYEKAIEAYNKSIAIDPSNKTPHQNKAVAYQYLKDWDNAILTYKELSKVDPDDPEVYYGLAIIYGTQKKLEQSLDSMCKAYNMYSNMHSPYRVDAENFISKLYHLMKEEGNEKRFNEILEENNIRTSSKE